MYADQIHGFALRGDWSSENDKKAMDVCGILSLLDLNILLTTYYFHRKLRSRVLTSSTSTLPRRSIHFGSLDVRSYAATHFAIPIIVRCKCRFVAGLELVCIFPHFRNFVATSSSPPLVNTYVTRPSTGDTTLIHLFLTCTISSNAK